MNLAPSNISDEAAERIAAEIRETRSGCDEVTAATIRRVENGTEFTASHPFSQLVASMIERERGKRGRR